MLPVWLQVLLCSPTYQSRLTFLVSYKTLGGGSRLVLVNANCDRESHVQIVLLTLPTR